MTTRLVVFALLSSVGLACGTPEGEAKSPADPWADFKGTYSETATEPAPRAQEEEGAREVKRAAKPRSEPAKAKAAPAKAEAHEIEAAEDLSVAAPARPASRGTIRGESVSTIGADALTEVAKATLKQRFVSSSTMTGPEYEVVRVQLKNGFVQIVRPAEVPSPKGPAIASPKSRLPDLNKNDASYYDAEADVLVVVSAGKKAASQRALKAIVNR